MGQARAASQRKGITNAQVNGARTLAPDELELLDAYWRAVNYLDVGQIYLLDNPLLREPLRKEHVQPRLLGHWGTTPGLNFVYVHRNRVIRRRDASVLYVAGPGNGDPALVANRYLERTYSGVYPDVSRDIQGMKRLFKPFSFPGGIPSHVAPETPGDDVIDRVPALRTRAAYVKQAIREWAWSSPGGTPGGHTSLTEGNHG